jgi:hypothetical protein
MFVMQLNPFKRFPEPLALLGVGGLAAIASVALGVAQPVRAAVSGNALPVTFTPGTPPTVTNGAPVGTIDSTTGAQEFEVIFDASNPTGGAFVDVNKFFSLQATSIKSGTGGGTINFKDVQFFVSGTTNSSFQFGGVQNINNASIAVWQAIPGSESQGFTNYSVANPVTTTTPAFGTGTNYRTASFDLTPLASPNVTTGLDAGQLNTLAFRPNDFGIATISQLRIKGLINGSSANGAQAAFGLALFNTDPAMNMGINPPVAIAGRAVNVDAFSVPGPLPLFGAGAAFGWSRKLRRRIGASKAAA